jgi:hypothetical protein
MYSNKMPYGGVDYYEGSRDSFDPFVQLRDSDKVAGKESIYSVDEYQNVVEDFSIDDLAIYQNMKEDIASSVGISDHTSPESTIFKRKI